MKQKKSLDDLFRTKRRKVEFDRIPKHSTAEIWMIGSPENPQQRVVSYHCEICRDPNNSRLVTIYVPTDPLVASKKDKHSGKSHPVRLLLHLTRDQLEEILRDMGKENNADTLRAVFYHKDEPSDNAVSKNHRPKGG